VSLLDGGALGAFAQCACGAHALRMYTSHRGLAEDEVAKRSVRCHACGSHAIYTYRRGRLSTLVEVRQAAKEKSP
jgi:DNA-directed RNA polymerase subunit RPC12/RpoP